MIRNLTLAASAMAIVAAATVAPAQDTIFQEENGLIVIEMESMPPSTGWALETSRGGFTGSGYYHFVGNNAFGSPNSNTIIIYTVRVDNPGLYNLRMRNQHNFPDHTEENDCWISVNGNHFDKMYNSLDGHNRWGWQSALEERGHQEASYNLFAGDNTIRIAGRSRGHKLDRMHLYRNGTTDPLSLSAPVSPIVGSVPSAFRYAFDGAADGWSRGGAIGGFATPAGGHAGDSLELVTNDNNNTFGYWESPELAIPDSGLAADYSLFEMNYRLRATTTNSATPHNPTAVPDVRLRASRPDFRETQEFVVLSNGSGAYAPNIAGRRYRHFVSQSDRNHVMKFFYDVMSFGGANDPTSFVYLDSIDFINRTGIPFRSSQEIASLSFLNGNTNGLNPVTGAPLGAANLFADSRGIGANANTNGDAFDTVFGTWTAEAGIPLNPSSVYEFRFVVASNAEPADRDKIGTVRVRVNDATQQSAVIGVYPSVNSAALLPVVGQPVTYRLWYTTDNAIGTVNPIISFDYLFQRGLGDNKDLAVFLQSVTVIEHKL